MEHSPSSAEVQKNGFIFRNSPKEEFTETTVEPPDLVKVLELFLNHDFLLLGINGTNFAIKNVPAL